MVTDKPTLQMPPSYRLAAFDSLDSTNSEILRTLSTDQELPQNLVVWAKTQTGGRGRRNRTWVSKPGNLFFSILKRPHQPVQNWASCSFAISLGLHGALSEILKQVECDISCKWPNDLLVDNAKISGILLETSNIQNPASAALIIGIGLNVKNSPDPVLYPVTYLENILKSEQDLEDILEILLKHIDLWFQKWDAGGFQCIRDDWINRAKGIGQEITVHLEHDKISGIFNGLDDQGSLILETPLGPKFISAGDVFFNN